MLDEIISLSKRRGAGAAFRKVQRSEYQWHGLRTNSLHQLSEINLPRLVMHGAEEGSVPVTWPSRVHNLMKNSEIGIIRGCGHLPPGRKRRPI
jgi:pimeloyl-ACP methyl ester carboxylesterase